jgi:hypothetical protein
MKTQSFVHLLVVTGMTCGFTPGTLAGGATNGPSDAFDSSSSPLVTNAAAPSANATPTNTGSPNPSPDLITHALPEIHGSIALPKDWTLLPGKLLEGDVLLATKEKISGENDLYTTGLSMTVDRNGAKDSGQKVTDYAMGLAREAREKAGEDSTPLRESESAHYHEISFDFSVPGDQPLQITEVLRADEKSGTLAVILWQSSKSDSTTLRPLRDAILSSISLNPEK